MGESEHFSKEGAVYFLSHSIDVDGVATMIEIDAKLFLKYFETNQIDFAKKFPGFSHLADNGNPVFETGALEEVAKMSLKTARQRYTKNNIELG